MSSANEPAEENSHDIADALAEIDALHAASIAAPADMSAQIRLWQAISRLDTWIFINRGTPEEPRPYGLAADAGVMVCIYSSQARAERGAQVNGLVPEGEPVPMFGMSLPAAMDWVMELGERGVVGVTIDYPQLGSWCPVANLARLRAERGQAPVGG